MVFFCVFFLIFSYILHFFFLSAWYYIHISNMRAYFSLRGKKQTRTLATSTGILFIYFVVYQFHSLHCTLHTYLVFLIDEKFLHTRLIYVEFTAITASFNNNLSAFVSFKLTVDEFRAVWIQYFQFFQIIKKKHIFELFFRICRFSS